jgi:hypothetical protein
MKKTLGIFLLAIPMLAQKPFPVDEHVGLRIVAQTDPKSGAMSGAHTEMKKDGPIHRVLRNSAGQILFAYDIEVKPSDGFYHVVTEPLNAAYARTLQTEPVPTLAAANDSLTTLGGHVMIELLANPATGQKISDDIMLVDITPAGAASDGNLHMYNADLWLNGIKLTAESMPGGAIGPRLAMYFQGTGGFFFSLLQPKEYPQFQKIGFIDNMRLKFAWGNKTFELISTTPFLSNGGSGEVWVFYDSQFRPKGDYDPKISWGTGEAMKTWLGNEEEEN